MYDKNNIFVIPNHNDSDVECGCFFHRSKLILIFDKETHKISFFVEKEWYVIE